MSIVINGSGTVTGISAGGLPDGCITTDELAGTVNVAKAWVNFNGTGTVAIRASGNVSSITDNATSDYTVNFTTAMSDANYVVVGIGYHLVNITEGPVVVYQGDQASGSVRVQYRGNGGNPDPETVQVAIFR